MKKQITVAILIMGVGALVVLIFSFLSFYSVKGNGDFGSNAWGGDLGLAPATFLPVFLAIVMLVLVVLELVGVKLPAKVLTFDMKQILAVLGISTAGMMLGWLLTGPEGVDKGAGLILMLLGSLAMAVGSIMNLLGMGANAVNLPSGSGSSNTPAAPGGPGGPSYPPSAPGSGYPSNAPGYAPQAPPPPPPGAGTPPPPPPPV